MKYRLRIALSAFFLAATLGCAQPLTTGEKGAGLGTVLGSALGTGIGSIWDYAINGGMIGAGLGLITGALVGDHFQELEKQPSDLDRQIEECERELQRLCDELDQIKREAEEE